MFTKEKWEIMPYTGRDGNNIRWVKAIKGKRSIPVCQTFRPHAEAKARLIAAAPDMLAACKDAGDIVQQSNLLSTTSTADKDATIKRLIDWLNGTRAKALAKAGLSEYDFDINK